MIYQLYLQFYIFLPYPRKKNCRTNIKTPYLYPPTHQNQQLIYNFIFVLFNISQGLLCVLVVCETCFHLKEVAGFRTYVTDLFGTFPIFTMSKMLMKLLLHCSVSFDLSIFNIKKKYYFHTFCLIRFQIVLIFKNQMLILSVSSYSSARIDDYGRNIAHPQKHIL